MKKYDYSVTICNQPDEILFEKQCAAIEKIPHVKKAKLLEDVDGSKHQYYNHPKGEISVVNDFYVGCLYVDSDFDLSPYFA